MADNEKEQFVLDAIQALRDPARSKGIHVNFSGFNQAFRARFGEDPRAFTEKMAAENKIVLQMRRGGPMMYFPEDAPVQVGSADNALAKIQAFRHQS